MTPRVSIIVPCFNEEATICSLLDSILRQTFPRGQMEVIVSDGLSEDGTRARIAAFQAEHPEMQLRIVDNQARTIPAALNSGRAGSQVAINAKVGQTILIRCLDAAYAGAEITFPVDAVIMSIIDSLEVDGEVVFRKS